MLMGFPRFPLVLTSLRLWAEYDDEVDGVLACECPLEDPAPRPNPSPRPTPVHIPSSLSLLPSKVNVLELEYPLAKYC
jgi:hypothetical protein